MVREGLPAGDRSRTSANAAAGSALVYAPAGNRVWAAEIGSYRITELDRRLRPRRSLIDPILVLKDEPSDDPDSDRADPEGRRELEDRIDAMTRELGTDLARRRTDGPRPRGLAQMVEFPRVIRAVAWDNQLNRLLVLLGEGIDGEFGAVDVLDPLTGEGQRYRLAFDPGSRQPQEPLAHMALTRRAIVFSSGRADSPAYRVYRLDRHQLHEREGTPIELPIEGEPSDEQDEPDDDS